MKRYLALFAAALLLFAGCIPQDPDPKPGPDPVPPTEEVKSSGITYQLLVYSFCDSDGDGIGDFAGITSKLDYLKSLGASALWLSPIHPASSYHGYDVLDYSAVNPDYGTETDLKNLIDQAHAKDIKIYLDFVLNHTSKDNPWFLDAKKGADSPYRDYYIFSDDPQADIKAGKIAMIEKNGYDAGQWFQCVSGGSVQKVKFTLTCDASDKPKTLKVEKTDNISNTGSSGTGKYLWWGDPGKNTEFYGSGNGTYTLSLELDSPWGVLVRTSTTQWDSYKYGAPSGKNKLSWGTPLNLSNSDAQDIMLPDMTGTWYHSHMWTSYFADLNYGPASSCENSPAFKAVTEAAGKWIRMGVDGFRLDAIKHIYHNASSDENPTFLKKFYDHCNATYKAAGHSDDIYMVGEHFSEAAEVAPYYKGLPAFFEFSFWWRLKEALSSGNGQNFVAAIQGYQKQYSQYRKDYIEATKLSNHDEDRAGSDLGRDKAKMKLAGAVLLTCSGQPFIYQGEELGYWGTKANGDEYVRTPVKWTRSGSVASGRLGGKVDGSMLSADISVEAQDADASSVLKVYKDFGEARSKCEALASGDLGYCAETGSSGLCAWYRTSGDSEVLVVHNFSGGTASVTFTSASLKTLLVSNGSVTVNGNKLTLGAYASAVFVQ